MNPATYNLILKRNPRKFQSGYLWRHVLFDFGLWLIMVQLSQSGNWFATTVTAVLFSIFSFRAFGLMHDCVHSAAHSKRFINNSLGNAFGVFCFLPFKNWRTLHLDHHKWTGNVERDPSMKILVFYKANGFKMGKKTAWCWRHWVPLLGFMQHLVFWRATLNRREFPFLVFSAIYLAAVIASLGVVASLLGMICYLYMVEVINFPHHLGMTQFDGESRFPTYEQTQFTRSCLYPKWLAHWVLLNFNLHNEHHLFPSHPWYQLDAIHDEVESGKLTVNFSLGNQWVLRNRKASIDSVFAKTFRREEDSKEAA